MALISLDEAKSYLRVDTEDEDAMIAILLSSAGRLCADVARLTDQQWAAVNDDNADAALAPVRETMRVAILYALGYLFEHREEADHQLTPPLLLSGKPCGWQSFMRSAICSSIGRKPIITV